MQLRQKIPQQRDAALRYVTPYKFYLKSEKKLCLYTTGKSLQFSLSFVTWDKRTEHIKIDLGEKRHYYF